MLVPLLFTIGLVLIKSEKLQNVSTKINHIWDGDDDNVLLMMMMGMMMTMTMTIKMTKMTTVVMTIMMAITMTTMMVIKYDYNNDGNVLCSQFN